MVLIRVFAILVVTLLASAVYSQQLGTPLEKFTGTWCGWCPYGAWVLDSIESRLGDKAVVLVWHFDDKFELEAHDTLSALVSNGGHPVVSIARNPVLSNQQLQFSESHPWYLGALEQLAKKPPISLDLSSIIYDLKKRQIGLIVTVTPDEGQMPLLESMKVVVALTEDDLPEDQKLYKESGGSLPDLKAYPHRNVVRQLAGSVLGDSMRYAWGPGWFFQPYSFQLNPVSDPAKTRINVIVIYDTEKGDRVVIAERSAYLSNFAPQSVLPKESSAFEIFPNPASDRLKIIGEGNIPVEISNVTGTVILKTKASGNVVDLSELPSGVYFVCVSVNGERVVRRLIIR